MAVMPREVATEKADLPHPFEGRADTCNLCTGIENDDRHLAYREIDQMDRETASKALNFRTFG